MKKPKSLLVLAALLIFASNANAALEEGTIVNFKLKAVTQNTNEEEIRPNVFESTTQEIRVTNKEVLRAIQIHNVLPTFPNGSRLIVDGSTMSVVAPDGTVLATATLTTSWGSEFFDCLDNLSATMHCRSRSNATAAITLGTKLAFSLAGLVTERLLHNYDTDTLQASYLFDNLVGLGTIDTVSALFFGEISGHRPAAILEEE